MPSPSLISLRFQKCENVKARPVTDRLRCRKLGACEVPSVHTAAWESFSVAPSTLLPAQMPAFKQFNNTNDQSSSEIPSREHLSHSECRGSSSPLPSFDKLSNQELAQTRNFSKLVAMLYNSATNFLIKLPSALHKTSLSSVLSQDPYTSTAQDPAKTPNTNPTSNKSRMQIYRWLPQFIKSKLSTTTNNNNNNCNGNINPKTDSDVRKSSKGLKGKRRVSHINGKGINIRTVRAMNLTFGGKDAAFRKQHHNSEKSSQKAVMERDVSVSDAIAHCRLSFGANK